MATKGPYLDDFGSSGKWVAAHVEIGNFQEKVSVAILGHFWALQSFRIVFRGPLGPSDGAKKIVIFTPEIPLCEIGDFLCWILR